jgi:sugar lactone lactonase YvrE
VLKLVVLLVMLAGAPHAPADDRAHTVGGSRTGPDSAAVPADTAAADTLPLRLARTAAVAPGEGVAGLVEPAGVAVDAFGRIYVTDAGLNRVQRYDAAGVWLGGAGTLGSDPGQLRRPGAVGALGNFGVAVLDRENRRVVSYDLQGRLLGTLIDLGAPPLSDDLGYVDPVALACDRGGAVVIADADRDRLLTFDFSGRYLRAIGGFGGHGASFRSLSGIACGPHGELVTSDRAHRRVQRLDAGGRVLGGWALAAGAGRGALPVAVDDAGRVAVADEITGRLWLFDAGGRLLARAEGCAAPRALAFAPDGTLLVAESRAARVSRWTASAAAAAGGHE